MHINVIMQKPANRVDLHKEPGPGQYLEMACEGERTFVGAAKLNQICLIVSFMLLESGGGGMRGRSLFRSSDSTPSSFIV